MVESCGPRNGFGLVCRLVSWCYSPHISSHVGIIARISAQSILDNEGLGKCAQTGLGRGCNPVIMHLVVPRQAQEEQGPTSENASSRR